MSQEHWNRCFMASAGALFCVEERWAHPDSACPRSTGSVLCVPNDQYTKLRRPRHLCGAITSPGGAITNPGGAITNPGGAITSPGGYFSAQR